ncbi:uncharacterized protein LOC103180987 [Callorhinchus milii]|uniref:uncharacterized protein LOC103180987 n=1 Tax=Callorhinchus milii TaxID=7868 RepID=UPI001C3F97B1|nr:uncharacterized protein LOC103180987 [Callorhinchus milii]
MRMMALPLLFFCFVQSVCSGGFSIKNVRLDKCIHANNESIRVSLADCNPESEHQHWRWDFRTKSIISLATKWCLMVLKAKELGHVRLGPCGNGQPQAWACSKRGHLTLEGFSLHLNVRHRTHKMYVSSEKGKSSKWRTMKEKSICGEANHDTHQQESPLEVTVSELRQTESSLADVSEAQTRQTEQSTQISRTSAASYTTYPVFEVITSAREHDRTVRITRTDDGSTWKIAMLILGFIALILGLIILTLNIIHNKKRKMLNITEIADSGDEKTSLTTSLKLQHNKSRSPSLRHGEIMIEWKDGKITPLFDNNNYCSGY